MQGDNLKLLEQKLDDLKQCILHQAKLDVEFASQLKKVLLIDSNNFIPPDKKKKEDIFNPVSFLHENGKGKLVELLNEKTNSELIVIIRSLSIMKSKELKGIERSEMLNTVINYAEKELNQGSVFL
jgi:hypothetical protein